MEVGLPDATLENRAESPLYGELYPNTKPVNNLHLPVPNSPIYAIYPIRPLGPITNTHKTHITTILQLSPNNYIVDYTFVLYKHILKSTILIHVMSKNHHATNRLLQNELSSRALHVPEIRGVPRRGELKLSRRIALSGLLTT